MRSRAAGCRGVGRPWSAAPPAAARRCWPWNSWCAARSSHGEPGVFIAFEETAEELTANVRSLGFDLDELTEREEAGRRSRRDRQRQIEENGEYDLDGLFIRLGYAIDAIGAKRVVLDTIETLFGGFSNQAILRAELRRLFRWLKDKGVTASSPPSAARGR